MSRPRRLPFLAFLCGFAALPPAARADTLKVPAHYPTIQAAVDAAVEGDVVKVAAGTWEEEVHVVGKSGITLKGSRQAVLTPPGVTTPLRIDNCQGLLVKGFTTRSHGALAVIVLDSDDLTLEKLRVEDSQADGVSLVDCDQVTIRKCRIVSPAGKGLTASNSTGLVLERNRIDGAGDVSIELGNLVLGPVTDSLVSRNRLLNGSADAIRIQQGSGNTLEYNRIRDCAGTGVEIGGDASDGQVVVHNRIRGTVFGIQAAGGSHQLEDNRLRDIEASGIVQVQGTGGSVLRGNSLRDIGFDGIQQSTDSVDDLIEDNSLRDIGSVGLIVRSDGTTVRDNCITRPWLGIFTDAPNLEVAGNVIKSAELDGFQVNGNDGAYSDNRVSKAARYGFHVLGADNQFTGNKSTKSGEYGLYDGENDNSYIDNAFDSSF